MLYGFYPPVARISVAGAKINGVASLGTASIGPVAYWDVNSSGKTNSSNQVSGDFGYTPTVWGFISDPDALDAPIYHGGFF